MTRVHRLIGFAALCGTMGAAAVAQTPIRPPQAPNMPPTNQVIPEKMKPEEPSATGTVGSGATLSEKLEATDGVIRPPANIDPEITAPAPVPNPGTTPVIPPPGSPGGNPSVVPK
jgi:hypothetical protein